MTEVQTPPTDPDVAQTEPPQTPSIVEYWGTDEKHKWFLPDGVQYFEFTVMNEGDKVRFQKLTNQDLTVGRDNTAKVKIDPAAERHTLIKTSLCGWLLYKDGAPLLFSDFNLAKWLEVAPPKIVEELEYAIRMVNPWMQSEETVEQIDKEIERLYDRRKEALARAEGEESSKNKSHSS